MTTYKLAVKGIIQREDGKILIVKRSQGDPFLSGIWETVGGGMEGEALPQEALKREIKEETDLEVLVNEPFNVFNFKNEKGEEKIGITFLCKFLSGTVKLSSEHSEYAWIRPLDFKQYESTPSLCLEITAFANKYNNEHERYVISQKAILIREGKCLIAEVDKRPNIWDLPGGRIDSGESRTTAFAREMKEELGLENFQVLATAHYDAWRTPSGHMVCGVASLITSDDEVKKSSEHTKLTWISEDEIDKYSYIWPEMSEMIRRGFGISKNL